MSAKGHITCQVGYAEGLVACYIPPSIPNMPKICKTWTQNMSRNAEVKKMGQRADYGKQNCSRTHVLTALTTMGICNVRALSLFLLKLIFEMTQYLVE
jgi:purine nucleoside permease